MSKHVSIKGVHSLASGRFAWNIRWLIFKLILVIDWCGISCETAIKWLSLDLNYHKSALGQVMAWRRQATSHYLSQCWPRAMSPYGVNCPQWVEQPCSHIFCPYTHFFHRKWHIIHLPKSYKFSECVTLAFVSRQIGKLLLGWVGERASVRIYMYRPPLLKTSAVTMNQKWATMG